MRKQRIVGNLMLFLLSQHDVHRVVKHDIRNARCGLRHKHSGLRFTPGQKRQCADVILMSMGDDDGFNPSIRNQREVWRCSEPFLFWMHAAVQNNRLPFRSEKVAVRPDLNVPRQIPKLHLLTLYAQKTSSGSGKFIFCETLPRREFRFGRSRVGWPD